MNEPTKIPADKVDALAERLQTSLKRGRPRTWLAVGVATAVAISLLAFLAWWLYKPTQVPRLEVIALDTVVAVGAPPHIVAFLALPDHGEYPAGVLRGHECVFEIGGKQAKADSDAQGQTAVDWASPNKPIELIAVRYVDVRYKQGSADQAKLFAWPPGSKLLVVDVLGTLTQIEPEQWTTMHGADIPPRPDAARALQEAVQKQYRVAYLAVTPATPLEYRKVRGWVGANRPAAEQFPAGPVLGRLDFAAEDDIDQVRRDRVKDLVDRFGDDVTLVTRTETAAAAGKSAGARVIVLDPAIKMPGVRSVGGWTDVIPQLDRKGED